MMRCEDKVGGLHFTSNARVSFMQRDTCCTATSATRCTYRTGHLGKPVAPESYRGEEAGCIGCTLVYLVKSAADCPVDRNGSWDLLRESGTPPGPAWSPVRTGAHPVLPFDIQAPTALFRQQVTQYIGSY